LTLHELVNQLHALFPIEDSMRQLVELCTLDRFQASQGIQAAAHQVADFAERAGLQEVRIRQFSADGERQWWTFRAPRAWTPVTAHLRAGATVDCLSPVTSYPDQACSLATNSSATPAGGTLLRLVEWPPTSEMGADGDWLAVIRPTGEPHCRSIRHAENCGAAGFAALAGPTDVPNRVGRIELPTSSRMFGFSVSRESLVSLLNIARTSGFAQATVTIERSAEMPLVEGILPGLGTEEILMTAHLCHHRPGANDNLSGVVGLLGVCRSLARLQQANGVPLQRSVRFLWAPEFTGMAAYLHDVVEHRQSPLPAAVINLDMIGEDQRRCGGPLILESPPIHVSSCLEAIAARCLSLLPQRSQSYSGAVPVDTWHWQPVPFVGASDHGLFADRAIARPAIMLGHWPDRFNHSSEDTPDKVSPDELRRTATVGGAVAWSLAAAPASLVEDVAQAIAMWGQKRMGAIVERAHSHHESASGAVDPWSAAHVAQLLAATHNAAARATVSAETFWSSSPASVWSDNRNWLNRQHQEFIELLPAIGTDAASLDDNRAPVLIRRWPGPFNLLGLTEDAMPADAEWIDNCLSESAGGYAMLMALALAIDDASNRQTVSVRAACESWLPIPRETANGFFDILVRAGWAAEHS
jgi:hypothetical protein